MPVLDLEMTFVKTDEQRLEDLCKVLIKIANSVSFDSKEACEKHQVIKSTLFMSHYHTTGKVPE